MPARSRVLLRSVIAALCSLLLLSASASAYETVQVKKGGTIKGVVRFDGDPETTTVEIELDTDVCGKVIEVPVTEVHKDGGLENAVVFIEEIAAGLAIDKTAVYRLEIKECRLEPPVLSMSAGQVLEITNADPIMHGLQALLSDTAAFNANLPMQNMKIDKRPREPGPMHLISDSGHDWISGWIYVVGHPYHALTDSKGRFTIKQIPPGDYRLTAWHAAVGVQTIDVHVESGSKTSAEFDALSPVSTTSEGTDRDGNGDAGNDDDGDDPDGRDPGTSGDDR